MDGGFYPPCFGGDLRFRQCFGIVWYMYDTPTRFVGGIHGQGITTMNDRSAAGPRTYDIHVRREDRDRWIADIYAVMIGIGERMRRDPRNAKAFGVSCDHDAPMVSAVDLRAALCPIHAMIDELVRLESIMESKADAAIGRPVKPKPKPTTTGDMFGGGMR